MSVQLLSEFLATLGCFLCGAVGYKLSTYLVREIIRPRFCQKAVRGADETKTVDGVSHDVLLVSPLQEVATNDERDLARMVPGPLPIAKRHEGNVTPPEQTKQVAFVEANDEGSARTATTATPLASPSPSTGELEQDLLISGSEKHAHGFESYGTCGDEPMVVEALPNDAAPSFTDGVKTYEPVMSPTGQLLYTDGEQVFMLACVPIEENEGSIPYASSVTPTCEYDSYIGSVEVDSDKHRDDKSNFSYTCNGPDAAESSNFIGEHCTPLQFQKSAGEAVADESSPPSSGAVRDETRIDASTGVRARRFGSSQFRRSNPDLGATSPDLRFVPPSDIANHPTSKVRLLVRSWFDALVSSASLRPRVLQQAIGGCQNSSKKPLRKMKTLPSVQSNGNVSRAKLNPRACQWPFGVKSTVALFITTSIILLGRMYDPGAQGSDVQALLEELKGEQAELQKVAALREMKSIEVELDDVLSEEDDEATRKKLEDRKGDLQNLRGAIAELSAVDFQAVPKETYTSFIGQVRGLLQNTRLRLSRRQQPSVGEGACGDSSAKWPFGQDESRECVVENANM